MCPLKRPNLDQAPGPKRSGWQVPASCGFCRLKKIRCDKQHPCSNCIAREITCEYASLPEGTGQPRCPNPGSRPTPLAEDIHEIKDSLKRMEQLLLKSTGSMRRQSTKDERSVTHAPHSEPKARPAINHLRKWDNLELIAATTEIEGGSDIRSTSASLITVPTSTETSSAQLPQEHLRSSDSKTLELLPQFTIAKALLEHFIEGVDGQCQVIHPSSTRSLLEQVYDQLSKSINPPDEVAVFLLSIFASASFYLKSETHSFTSSSSTQPTLDAEQSQVWKEHVLSRIFHIDHMSSSSLMSLQSALILLLFLWDAEGQSKRYHTLKGLSYVKAMQLGCHKIDAESLDAEPDTVEREMKRRLWWHLACSDWLVGSAPGKQLGICMINPHHMTVNYPANVAIEHFKPEGHGMVQNIDNGPTSVSFFIYRIKFAELCRDAMDDLQRAKTTSSPQRIYELVLEISDRYVSFLDQLPWFLRFDGDKSRLAELAQKRPYNTQQRAILLYGIYSRLGRLHRPFVTRGVTDPDFLTSYKIGIDCAEKLMTIRKMPMYGQLDMFGLSHSFDQHSFNAMILLALDVMAHPNLLSSERRRSEVIEMCSLLKDKHIQLGQTANGLNRAIELLLEIVQTPKKGQSKLAIDTPAPISVNTDQHKDGKVAPRVDVSPVAEVQFQMPGMDESSLTFWSQDYNILFDDMEDYFSDLNNVLWGDS